MNRISRLKASQQAKFLFYIPASPICGIERSPSMMFQDLVLSVTLRTGILSEGQVCSGS
jgi:hypothetical protein